MRPAKRFRASEFHPNYITEALLRATTVAGLSTGATKWEAMILKGLAPLTDDERAQLQHLLKVHYPEGPFSDSMPRLHGFFCSVVSGPLIMPSEWLDTVLGIEDEERGWNTIEEAKSAYDLLMRFYNSVVAEFESDQPVLEIIARDPGDETAHRSVVRAWCEGYILGILAREQAWRGAPSDPVLAPNLDPIVALADPKVVPSPAEFRAMFESLPQSVSGIKSWWRAKLSKGAPNRRKPSQRPRPTRGRRKRGRT